MTSSSSSSDQLYNAVPSTQDIVSAPNDKQTPGEPPNPFVHAVHLTPYDKISVAVLTFTVLPVRFVIALLLLVVTWGLSGIGLSGLSKEDLASKPLTGWRKRLRNATCFVVRMVFVVCGFHWVNVKGRQASPKEAPILVIAPHSSFFDGLLVVCLGGPSIVAKIEAAQSLFFGRLMNFTQPVYVRREDADSRHNTIKEMQRRSHSNDEWHQIAIFPEGTCTNRSSLITFKLGAFYPGVPVQPVCVKYPNRLDTMTWTLYGPKGLLLLWLSLCQLHLRCEIEFLPVYTPSDEEIKNPRLFANNVRQKMAIALGIPVSEYSYGDFSLLKKENVPILPTHEEEEHANGQISNGAVHVHKYSAGESVIVEEQEAENGSIEEHSVKTNELPSAVVTNIVDQVIKAKTE